MTKPLTSVLNAMALSLMAAPALADTINGDLSVRGDVCLGLNCNTTETFDLEILKIKSALPWLKFEDLAFSTTPSNDWQLRANDNMLNGEDYFAIEDLDGATLPFRVDAGAPSNALRVTSDGSIGLGTGLPQSNMHLRSGNSLSLRFEQDGSSGATPQTWDMGANSSNFFLRDITNNRLPFRVFPGTGNTSALIIAGDGSVGLGTLNPEARLHVAGTSMLIKNAGRVNFTLSDTSDPGPDFRTQLTAGTARFSFVGTGAPEMELFQSGDLAIRGRYISAGTQLTVPDYVFDDDYALRPLAEVQSFIDAHSHLPDVPSAADIAQDGLDMTEMQMTLLKKIEELTLYTLKQEATIKAQQTAMAAQHTKDAAQRAKVDALEQMIHALQADMAALQSAQD